MDSSVPVSRDRFLRPSPSPKPASGFLMVEERVILVDAHDVETGTAGKLHAHRAGLLHRAVSVFVFGSNGSILLQRRARGKYHSGGLWTNTCCGHPRPGEAVADAARRRLREEMGVECELREVLCFTYRADLGGGLTEHELDHVLVGTWDGTPLPDPSEVEAWRWAGHAELERRLRVAPERFTAWFPLAWRAVGSVRATSAAA